MRIAAVAAALLVLYAPEAALAQAKRKPAPPARQQVQSDSRGHLLAAAQRGDEVAQHQLGLAYRDGRGMPRDPVMAVTWFALAGSNGVAEAAVEAARAFEQGAGIRRDMAEAGRWWHRAGQLGDVAARRRFVELFVSGAVRSLDGVSGAGWVAETARQGSVEAQLALGEAFERGLGIAPDRTKAEEWYRAAAILHADAEARFRLGRMLLAVPGQVEHTEQATLVTRPGMVEGERWLRAAARQGHAEASYLLGLAMVEGIELPFDLADGIAHLEAAAARGHAGALMALADLAFKGQGFSAKDPIRAYVWYDIAAAVDDREKVAKAMTAKQLARARQLAQDWRDVTGL